MAFDVISSVPPSTDVQKLKKKKTWVLGAFVSQTAFSCQYSYTFGQKNTKTTKKVQLPAEYPMSKR